VKEGKGGSSTGDGRRATVVRTNPGFGRSRRNMRWLNVGGTVVIACLAIGWGWSLIHSRTALAAGEARGGRTSITAALTKSGATSTAYLTDAALEAYVSRILTTKRGTSGRLRAAFQDQSTQLAIDSTDAGVSLRYAQRDTLAGVERPAGAGVWRVLLAVGNALRPVADFNLVTRVPFTAKERGKIGTYVIGSWPAEHGAKGPPRAPADRYANPSGFIEVTLENKDTRISDHFRLGDFLTKGQANVWPKYLVLELRLVDKLELVLADLQQRGIKTEGVRVMSGFRTPSYNEGGGNTAGRADLSRHMFGDAADIFIDNDGNGVMDDLNRDGKVDINDSRVMLGAVDRVEAAHPELVGGGGLYRASSGHGPFIHIDTRGYRARW
jgi:hypothetical protein